MNEPARGSLLGIEHLEAEGHPGPAQARPPHESAEGPSAAFAASVWCFFFYEASTRTRSSFEVCREIAGVRSPRWCSLPDRAIEKGESLLDTGYTLRAVGADCIVIRPSVGGRAAVDGAAPRHPGDQRWRRHARASVAGVARCLYYPEAQEIVQRGCTLRSSATFFHSRVARSACHLLTKFWSEAHTLRSAGVCARCCRLPSRPGLRVNAPYRRCAARHRCDHAAARAEKSAWQAKRFAYRTTLPATR